MSRVTGRTVLLRRMNSSVGRALTVAITSGAMLGAANAWAISSWNDGAGQWTNAGSWLPNGVPGSTDSVFIGDTLTAENEAVTLNINDTIASLSVTDGMWLDINDVELLVNGDTTISGRNQISVDPNIFRSTRIRVIGGSNIQQFDTDNLFISNEADLRLSNDALVEVDNLLSINTGATVHGEGRIDFVQNGGTVLNNNSLIYQSPNSGPTPLHFRATNGGLFDLDGASGSGRVSLATSAINGVDVSKIIFEGTGLADAFDGEISIAGGNELSMDLVNGWILGTGGEVRFSAGNDDPGILSGGPATINGNVILSGSDNAVTRADWRSQSTTIESTANFTLSGSDRLEFDSPGGITVNGGAFDMGANARVVFIGPTTMNGGTFNNADGGGTVIFGSETNWNGTVFLPAIAEQIGNATVTGDTTIFSLGVFEMEASFIQGQDTVWTLNADLNVNAAQIGDIFSIHPERTDAKFVINHFGGAPSVLNMNLVGSDEWELIGTLEVNAPNDSGFRTMEGDAVVLLSQTDINSGNALFYNKVTFRQLDGQFVPDSIVNIDQDAALRLLSVPNGSINRIEGATINGPGELQSAGERSLTGFGTINAPVKFFTDSELRADDGTLNLSGAILDVGTIGTADTDGTLNVTQPWATSVADQVELLGGFLTGANITNDGTNGIVGHGQATAAINNNTRIAAQGGTLVINNNNTDWDGTTGNGQLFALTGNLELIGTGEPGGFNGDLSVEAPHEIFINGFNLDFTAGSTITMVGGDLRSNVKQTFRSDLATFQLPAHIRAAADFFGTSTNALSTDLNLHGDTFVEANASFTGTGRLIAHSPFTITFDDGAGLKVDFRGLGTTVIEDGIGDTTVSGNVDIFGLLELELAGNTANLYDRFIISDTFTIRGEIDVDLLGYNPVAGDVFDVLDFTTFVDLGYTLDLPSLDAGLFWITDDFETQGILRISAIPTPTAALGGLALLPMLLRRRR